MNYKDPTNEGLWETDGEHCEFCGEKWGSHHLETTPTGEFICPNCRLKCDYCEQYFPTNEITRVTDGKACSDCLFDHALLPLDQLELFDTLSMIMKP